MTGKILVTYATRSCATSAVAETIALTLREQGLLVDVRSMREVSDLEEYEAVIAGSPIQGHQWLPEALQFVQSHQADLRQKPFAAFLLCMALAMHKTPAQRRKHAEVASWLAPVRALVPTVSEGLFAGTLMIRNIPSLVQRLECRLNVLLGEWEEGDFRDWNAIRAWARALGSALQEPVLPLAEAQS